jgi:hypothetical protein
VPARKYYLFSLTNLQFSRPFVTLLSSKSNHEPEQSEIKSFSDCRRMWQHLALSQQAPFFPLALSSSPLSILQKRTSGSVLLIALTRGFLHFERRPTVDEIPRSYQLLLHTGYALGGSRSCVVGQTPENHVNRIRTIQGIRC